MNLFTYFSYAKTHLATIENKTSEDTRIPSPPINKERPRDFASEEEERKKAISGTGEKNVQVKNCYLVILLSCYLDKDKDCVFFLQDNKLAS